jgi:sec-independent protein translocase protein TatB
MFDVGFSELVLMAIVALVVLGPEKLPHAARVAGAWVGRIRRTVSNVQAEIEREVSAQELRERLQKEIDAAKDMAHDATDIQDPFQAIVTGAQEMASDVKSILPPATAVGTPATAATATTGPVPDTAAAAPGTRDAAANEPVADGEQAYRDWLASQKSLRQPPTAPDITPGKDETAS